MKRQGKGMGIDDAVCENMPWLMQQASRMTDNREDAEDLASETAFRCLLNAGRFDPSLPFQPWAMRIMTNITRVKWRHKKERSYVSIHDHHLPMHADTDQRVRVDGLFSEIRRCARRSCCIECVLLYAKGYSYEEISRETGVLVNTVKSRIAAGRTMLREAVGM